MVLAMRRLGSVDQQFRGMVSRRGVSNVRECLRSTRTDLPSMSVPFQELEISTLLSYRYLQTHHGYDEVISGIWSRKLYKSETVCLAWNAVSVARIGSPTRNNTCLACRVFPSCIPVLPILLRWSQQEREERFQSSLEEGCQHTQSADPCHTSSSKHHRRPTWTRQIQCRYCALGYSPRQYTSGFERSTVQCVRLEEVQDPEPS